MGMLFQIIFIPLIFISGLLSFFSYYSLKNKIAFAIFKGLTTLLILFLCAASFFIYNTNGGNNPGHTLFISLLLGGLVFSFAGDMIILIRKTPFFIIALLCFACTHIAYTLCFIFYTHFSLVDIITGLVAFVSGLLLYKYFFPHLKRLKIPVAFYIFIITFMVWRALPTLYNGRLSIVQGILLSAGAILFYASDFVLGRNMFIKRIKKFVIINFTLYYLGQLFIALSCYYFFK